MEAASVMLDADSDQVAEMIDDGRISMAWDIASQGATRREIRIWRDSVVAQISGEVQPDFQSIDRIVPDGTRELRTRQLQHMLAASQEHIARLAKQGLLTAAGRVRRGPRGLRITRDSLIKFLQSRRII